jgi:hypothetical protein
MIEVLRRGARRWPWLARAYHSSRASLREAAQRMEVPLRHAPERRRLECFRHRHRGDRCFVIGNGPSLRGLDLSPLAGEVTFATNHFYFHPQVELLQPTYYCASDLWFFDKGIHPEWPRHLSRLPRGTAFFLPVELKRRVGASVLRDCPNIHYLRCDRRRQIWRRGEMSVDATGVLGTGDSVIVDFCLPLAHFMGFSEVYLLGCDTDYGPGDGATHFYEASTPSRSVEYHRDTWYENVTCSYTVARGLFEAAGRRIYNATAGGRLEVFPRVGLEDALRRS